MRVLIYSHQAGYIYGGEIVTLALAKELKERGVAVFFAAPRGPYLDRFRKVLGERVSEVPSREFRRTFFGIFALIYSLPRVLATLCSLISQHKIEIVHANTLKSMVYAWPLAILLRQKIVWHHHDILAKKGLNNFWLRLLAAGAVKVIVPSHAARNALLEAGIPSAKVVAVWNGFNPEEWNVPKEGRPLRPFQIYFVGELSKRKGADLLPAIAQNLLSLAKKPFHIQVVGDSLSEPGFALGLMEETLRGGLGKVLAFLGRREDVKELLQGADALILPSRQDPFPTVILEAAFSGVPIVAAPVGGVPEMFREGEGGRFASSAFDIAKCLAPWVEEPNLARSAGMLARSFAEEHFTVRLMTEKVINIYKNC